MLSQITECVCDCCGNAEHHDTWHVAEFSYGWTRKKINDKYRHFCSPECLRKYLATQSKEEER